MDWEFLKMTPLEFDYLEHIINLIMKTIPLI